MKDADVLGGRLPLLYIDDSEDDRIIIQAVIRRTKTRFTLYTADNPESAAAHFQTPAISPGQNLHPFPALVLLDYKLGIQTAADFLYWLRVRMQISSIPVIMYSGSSGSRHVSECYASGANHFLRKGDTLSAIQTIFSTLNHCMSFTPPRFGQLIELPEYEPDPGTGEQLFRTKLNPEKTALV